MTASAPSYSQAARSAAARVLARQPGFVRRKDSLTAIAGTVLQVINLLTIMETDVPLWVHIVIAVVVGIAQTVIHAATKAAITPSIVEKVSEESKREDEEYVGQHRLEE